MNLDPDFEAARVQAMNDMAKAGIGTHPNHYVATQRLRAILKVQNPVSAATKLSFDPSVSAAEQTKIRGELQGIFDMLPPIVARNIGHFHVEMFHEPGGRSAKYGYDGSKQIGTMRINRAEGGLIRKNIWHEFGHHLFASGPGVYRDRIMKHFRRRTALEPLESDGDIQFRRDKLSSDYEGRVYPPDVEPNQLGAGLEIPSTRLEHLSAAAMSLEASLANPDRQFYLETSAVALSIFYHGRGLP